MEKLLIMGINTRGLVNSSLTLPYKTYSASYYCTFDFKLPYKEKHILKQKEGISCGFIEKNYNPGKLLELSKDFIEEVDGIVLSSGISCNDFKGIFKKHKRKIIGNQKTEHVEDKYKFYKKIKNKYLTPKTFKINYGNNEDNISEILEIAKQYTNISFIVKPLQGSGGYGVSYIKYNDENEIIFNSPFNASKKNKDETIDINKFYNEYIKYENSGLVVQEYINGKNISSSILSTKEESKTIVTSNMLTDLDFGIKNSFKYCGNIVPFNINSTNNALSLEKEKNTMKHIKRGSEDLISYLKLIGSNGLDMIIDKNLEEPYIIEVNPRFQGTYECIEELLGINLLEAHIKACEGELIEIPKIPKDTYSIKRIIYSPERIKLKNNIDITNVYDIPYKGVIIEKDEPVLTIITPKDSISNVKNEVNNAVYLIEKEFKNDKKVN